MSKQKLLFTDIGKGRLGTEIQAAFEQAAISARDLNGKCSVVLQINVYPPESDPKFGSVDFCYKIVEAPRKSKQYTTLIQDGILVNEGDSEAGALQYDMELTGRTKNTILFTGKAKAEE